VLGADTEVVIDGEPLGKAADEAGARRRLLALSGRTHEVIGAISLLDVEGGERAVVECTAVTFAPLDDRLLALYLGSGEWRDRAGAYAVQGLGAALIERVEGDLANVIGLPVRALLRLAPELASEG
jgi:septum formation protein